MINWGKTGHHNYSYIVQRKDIWFINKLKILPLIKQILYFQLTFFKLKDNLKTSKYFKISLTDFKMDSL